jgi:hypothetical protein
VIAASFAPADVEGLTLSGGEPMQQAPAALELLLAARRRGLSTLMFSGYTRAELAAQALGPAVLAHLDVLVDGRYQADERPGLDLRGSSNQRVHLLTARHRRAEVEATPEAEIRIGADGSAGADRRRAAEVRSRCASARQRLDRHVEHADQDLDGVGVASPAARADVDPVGATAHGIARRRARPARPRREAGGARRARAAVRSRSVGEDGGRWSAGSGPGLAPGRGQERHQRGRGTGSSPSRVARPSASTVSVGPAGTSRAPGPGHRPARRGWRRARARRWRPRRDRAPPSRRCARATRRLAAGRAGRDRRAEAIEGARSPTRHHRGLALGHDVVATGARELRAAQPHEVAADVLVGAGMYSLHASDSGRPGTGAVMRGARADRPHRRIASLGAGGGARHARATASSASPSVSSSASSATVSSMPTRNVSTLLANAANAAGVLPAVRHWRAAARSAARLWSAPPRSADRDRILAARRREQPAQREPPERPPGHVARRASLRRVGGSRNTNVASPNATWAPA